jgi:hypothetical protein
MTNGVYIHPLLQSVYNIQACSGDYELIHTNGFSWIHFVKYLLKPSDGEVLLNDI